MSHDREQDEVKRRRSSPATFQSPTFDKDGSFRVNEAVGSASISPGGRDVVLASRQGLHIIDLDNPYSPPRFLSHHTPWEVADVQWSPFASRDYWIASTSNQKALIWNLELSTSQIPIQHVLHAHSRAITDINFSAHEPDILATCAVDSFIHCWDLRQPATPVISFAEWISGATQVKWNRQDANVLASSHDRALYVWDRRKSAQPLRIIDAHTTKIYGIDWSRVDTTQLLTCSSDKTIRLWDYAAETDKAIKVIRTSYPVWRARHTPFGTGILAMPQRGNNNLYLYDSQSAKEEDFGKPMEPVHSFTGHGDQVKEFLWRVRHGTEEGKDDRAFQLVSWGSDRNLLLHRMDDVLLDKVGFQRGGPADRRFRFTRKGATYRTFHETKLPQAVATGVPPLGQGLTTMFREIPRSAVINTPITMVGNRSPYLGPSQPGMRVYSGEKKRQSAIAWMKGVKIFSKDDNGSARDNASHMTSSSSAALDIGESLGDEITYAGDKYKKVAFEEVDVLGRSVTFTLGGPWGIPEDSLVHLEVSVQFPREYPERPPHLRVEKTSVISDAAFTKLKFELRGLCEAYASIGRGCLEAVLCYLMGEQTLQESIAWIARIQGAVEDSTELRVDDSSSDEDEVIGRQAPQQLSGQPVSGKDAPLPKGCGALWAQNGQLVCFFPSKTAMRPVNGELDLTVRDLHAKTSEMFEGFGRLHINNWTERRRQGKVNSHSSDSESSELSYSSSSSSGCPDEDHDSFSPIVRWGAATAKPRHLRSLNRSTDFSHQSNSKMLGKHENGKPKTYVTIQSGDDMMPSKKALAEGYIIFGDGPAVCSHNATVASEHGLYDLADVWSLVNLILCDEVPLEVLPQNHRKEEILVLARRALVQIKRRDSGLDLLFDKPESVVNPKLKGHVKWGHHPLAGAWLVDLLFEHFENEADVQMLAMLSCVFSEPAASEGASNALKHLLPRELPMALKAPAFSLDYFPSKEAAWSQFEAEPTPMLKRKSSNLPIGTFGSFTSSNGPWSSDATLGDGDTPHSAAISPPSLMRRNSRGSNVNVGQSLSSSPEHEIRRSNSINAFASSLSFSRSLMFGLSASPPTQRIPASQLSSSVPTANPLMSGITSARHRGHDDTSSVRFVEPRSSTTAVYDDYPDSDADVSVTEDEEIIITLKNQNIFDDEACFSAPLLKPEDASKHRAYREAYASLLDVWNLPQIRCEILKFNGLKSYFPEPDLEVSDDGSVISVGIGKTHGAVTNEPATSAWPSQQHQGLALASYCAGCGIAMLLRPFKGELPTDRPRCADCQVPQQRVFCGICFESVRGLYKPCLGCGHVIHAECQESWLATARATGDGGECELGCGCDCSQYSVIASKDLDGEELFEGLDDEGSMMGEVGTETETETATTVAWDASYWDERDMDMALETAERRWDG